MKYITLGNSDLKVSRLCLGCMSFGEAQRGQYQWTIDYESSEKIINDAYESGINFFDTSNNYSDGSSEQFLGKAIKRYDRKDLIIATKCYFNEGHLSPEAIHREVANSLKRLDTPYVDLLILHRFDYDTPVEDTLKALDEEIKMGHIRYYGASAMYGYQFAEYCYKAKELGYQPFVTLQNHYNPVYREDERDLIPVARQFGVSQTSFSPLASGRLARRSWGSDTLRYALDKQEGTRYDAMEAHDKVIAERVYELSVKYNVPMSTIALAWQFKKGVASPIIGVTKPKHLEDALKVFDVELTDEDVKYLDQLYIPHPITSNR